MPSGAIGVGSDPDRHIKSSGNLFYDHIVTPNLPSCLNYNSDFAHSTYAVSSEHRGGVNVLFSDGAVKFVGNNVDRKVWRAVGTRNGHESVTLP
jgi:prepilin-type processing-associated H-X9-DG protein